MGSLVPLVRQCIHNMCIAGTHCHLDCVVLQKACIVPGDRFVWSLLRYNVSRKRFQMSSFVSTAIKYVGVDNDRVGSKLCQNIFFLWFMIMFVVYCWPASIFEWPMASCQSVVLFIVTSFLQPSPLGVGSQVPWELGAKSPGSWDPSPLGVGSQVSWEFGATN